MANTGQLGTTYSQLGGIILGASESGDNSVKQHGQAQSQIVYFDVRKYAQSQGQILSEYQVYGQAEVKITYLITYQSYAQADSQIVYVYTYSAVSNSLSQILATYSEVGQAQGQILTTYFAQSQAGFWASLSDGNPYNQGYANAQTEIIYLQFAQANALYVYRGENGEYIWPQYGNSQAQILVLDNQAYSQAFAWIALTEITTIFYDSFTRIEGSNWGITDSNDSYIILFQAAGVQQYATGSKGVVYNSNTYSSGMDFAFGPFPRDFEISFEIKYVGVAGSYNTSYFVFRDTANSPPYDASDYWNTGIQLDIGSTYVDLQAEYGTEYNRATISYDEKVNYVYKLKFDNDKVYFKLWPVGNTEPTEWTNQITVTHANDMQSGYVMFEPWLRGNGSPMSVEFDNIIVIASGPMPYNLGRGQAQAQILVLGGGDPPRNQVYSQAQVIMNQALVVAQANTYIKIEAQQKYAQANALLNTRWTWGQAQARINIVSTDPNSFRYIAYADGAKAYWGMNSQSVSGILKDEKGPFDFTSGTVSKILTSGYVKPEQQALQWYSYQYHYFSGGGVDTSLITTNIWTLETWFKPNLNNISTYETIFTLFDSSYRGVIFRYGALTSSPATHGAGTEFYVIETTSGTAGTGYSAGSYASNTWHHLVITSNNGARKLYVDGSLKASWSGTERSWYYFYINRNPYNSQISQYEQYRDDLVLYDNVELTAEQVMTHFNAATELKSRYGQSNVQIGWPGLQGYAQALTQTITTYSYSAQAFAILNTGFALAQAEVYLKSFGWVEVGQAQAKLNSFDNRVYAQAQTMIIPRHGLLKYFIQGSTPGASPWPYNLPDVGKYSEITSITADTSVTQINLGDLGDNYGVRWQAWFIADRSGLWYFKTTSDDGSGIYIYNEQNQLVGSMVNGYPGGQSGTTRDSDTSPNTRINLVEGQKYKIDVKWAEGGGGAILQAWYRRPGDTADIWLLDGLAPWNDKNSYRRFAQANSWTVYRGPGGEYIWPQFGQAQAKMVYTALNTFGQAQVQIGAFRNAQAITQILNETDQYRLAVLANDPMFYFPMDETVYTQGLRSIVGRRNGVWDSSGAIFEQSPALLSGTSIDFNGRAATIDLPINYGTIQENLTIPGTQMSFNSMWKISDAFWLNNGESVTITVNNLYDNGSNISLGIWGMRSGDNQYAYIGTNPTGTYTRTATTWDIYFVYIYPQSGNPVVSPTGSGTFMRPDKGESILPMEYGSPITVEGWFKWDGTSNEDMIFGFNSNDLFLYGASGSTAYLGFNDGAGHQYGPSTRIISSNRWYHFAAVFYNGQAASTANKLYIDGVSQTLSGSTDVRYIDQKFVIGGWINNTGYQWGSFLDEIAVYNYELTAEQVLTHYRARIILWYAQSQARIYSFGYPQWAQAQAYMKGLEFAQAMAWIKGYPYKSAQATSLIIHDGEGFVRMIWSGEYTPYPQNIIAWGIEDQSGQIYYDDGTGPPDYPGSNAGAAWTTRFTADITGTWQFRTVSDDNSEILIDSTVVVANYDSSFLSGGHGDWDRSGSIALTQGQEYNLHIRWTQGGGPYTIHVYYKRPTDSDWYLVLDNKPPWLPVFKIRKTAQAQAEILPRPFVQQWGQAEARIIAFKVKAYAQAKTQILTTYRKYALAGTQFGHWQYGLSRTKVLRMYQAYAQALTQFGHWQYGLSKAHIRAFDIRKYGQAQAYIVRSTHGQAQGHIKQTYPLFSLNNYALTNLGAVATAYPPESTIEGPVSNIFDQFIYTVWTNALLPVVTSTVNPTVDDDLDHGFYEGQNWINTVTQTKFILVDGTPGAAVWEVTTVTNTYLQIDLGVARTVNAYAILPVKYNATVTIAYSNNGTSWTNLITDIFFDVYISNPASYEDLIQGFLPQAVSARYWRIIVQNGGDDNGISLGTLQLGFATIVNPTFAQAQVQIGHFQLGISGALIHRNEGYALAKALIIQTYQKYSQADSWVIPPYGSGLSQAQVLQTYSEIANANAWIIPPTEVGQAEASIKVFGVNKVGLAKTHILVFEAYTANARAKIVYPQGYGQANAHIRSFNNRRVGGAIAYVGHIKLANAHAFIVKTKLYAQSQAQILKLNNGRYGQALCWIDRSERFANARATILTTYRKYGQAGAILNTGFGLAQAKALILRTYEKLGNTRAHIKRTYEQLAQAQLSIYWRIKALGQARVMIVKQRTSTGLVMAQIGGFNYGQSQAYLWAFNVPKVGNACGYILASTNIVPSPPTSGMATYLVMFNGQTLPGYAQSESYDSLMNITDHYAAYLDSSLSEYTGLQNKSIELVMLVWEPTYFQCKMRVQEAATILRSVRKRFVKMYIQHRDKYYLVMPKTISMSKSVGESTQILPYTITFEAKPWLIENAVNIILGTGTIDTGTRPLTSGGWTPTTILVSGTDVTISGITETGQDTGTVSLQGTVSNFVIDSEAFTSTDNSIITPKNYGIYVGPGKTTFTITGATSCIIQWQNRYYL